VDLLYNHCPIAENADYGAQTAYAQEAADDKFQLSISINLKGENK